jgi:stage II sporulation protein AA (anti-sigma F factor antagonist)
MFERARNGSIDVISGDAPLNTEHAPEALRVITDCLKSGQARLVFDLRNVPLIDSAGLELLLDARDRCLLQGGGLQLAAATPLCRDVLRATGVGQEIGLCDDVVQALGSFSQ